MIVFMGVALQHPQDPLLAISCHPSRLRAAQDTKGEFLARVDAKQVSGSCSG
jgi:hypothetical protein